MFALYFLLALQLQTIREDSEEYTIEHIIKRIFVPNQYNTFEV